MPIRYGFIRRWWMTTFFDVKFARNVSDVVREICSRYGDQVVGSMFTGPYSPPRIDSAISVKSDDDLGLLFAYGSTRFEMRAWLAEQLSIREYRERWIPIRDFVLEIVVIALIGWEIHLGYKQEEQQSSNFEAQQRILTNLNTSSKSTADTLLGLKSTTEESKTLSERSALAAESNAASSNQSL